MTWFKIDDSFYDHPKIFDAPDCAVALWTRAGTWSARNLTDGFVPAGMPARLCDDPERAVKELLDRGLWKRAKNGLRFHDWNDYQPTAESVRTTREKKASAGRMGGVASARARAQSTALSVKQTSSRHGHAGTSEASSLDTQTGSDQGEGRSKLPSRNEARASSGASRVLEPPTRPEPKILGGALGDPLTPGASEAPPPRCPEHLEHPTDDPCRACGDARRARTRWELADAERRRTAPKCRRHRGQPADNCALCRSEALAVEEDS